MSQPDPPFRCSDAARVRADPLAGSAPPAQRWLLLEHPGPWRTDAIAGAGIDPDVLSTLVDRAGSTTRILLIRRPGRIDRRAARRWILTALDSTTVTGQWRTDHDLLGAADALTAPATRLPAWADYVVVAQKPSPEYLRILQTTGVPILDLTVLERDVRQAAIA